MKKCRNVSQFACHGFHAMERISGHLPEQISFSKTWQENFGRTLKRAQRFCQCFPLPTGCKSDSQPCPPPLPFAASSVHGCSFPASAGDGADPRSDHRHPPWPPMRGTKKPKAILPPTECPLRVVDEEEHPTGVHHPLWTAVQPPPKKIPEAESRAQRVTLPRNIPARRGIESTSGRGTSPRLKMATMELAIAAKATCLTGKK